MLKGLKVLEFEGLAPSVFLGMHFADQGADVILVARPEATPFSIEINKNILNRNKKCIKLSLKDIKDKIILTQMIQKVDVIIDPFRPGVLEKEKLGPKDLYTINPKIILLRVSGYGQYSQMSLKPGHDLNYISKSGILKLINQSNDGRLQFPSNYLADFVSASLGIVGTLKALNMRDQSGEGFVVDCSLAGGCSYLASLVKSNQQIQDQNNAYRISYFQANNKRYVVTEHKTTENSSKDSILSIISQMQLRNEQFFKNREFQIALVKKIPRIKDSKLKNPFASSEGSFLSDIIPQRDGNREEILNMLQIPQAKL